MKKFIDQLAAHRTAFQVSLLAVSLVILFADYYTGPRIRFPVLLIIPVSLASWYMGKLAGLSLAIVLPLLRFGFIFFWNTDITPLEGTVNFCISIFALSFIAYMTDLAHVQNRKLEKHVQRLEGILPICSFCKQIRDRDNQWVELERYLTAHSEAQFSHGLCPDCAREHYGQFLQMKNEP